MKSFKTYQYDNCLSLIRMKFINNSECILASDRRYKTLNLIDKNGNFIKLVKKMEHLTEPFALCVSKMNKIYVGDHVDKKIIVFDQEFNCVNEFHNENLIESSSIAIDEYDDHDQHETGSLYVTSKFMNTITVWNSVNGAYITKFKINKPEFINVLDEHRLVVIGRQNNNSNNATNYFLADTTSVDNKNIIYSSNCIFIVNKHTFDIMNKICLNNWFDLKGLYIDHNLNIYTCAKEYEEQFNNNITNNEFRINNVQVKNFRYLYVFHEKSGYCLQKTKIELLSEANDMLIYKNKAFFCHRDMVKIVEFI